MARVTWCLVLVVLVSAETAARQGLSVSGAEIPSCDSSKQGFLYGIVLRPLVIRGTILRLWSDSAEPAGFRDWSTVQVNEVLKGRFQSQSINILGHDGKQGGEYLFALPDVGTPFLSRGGTFTDCAAYILEVHADQVVGHVDSLSVTSTVPLSRIRAALTP